MTSVSRTTDTANSQGPRLSEDPPTGRIDAIDVLRGVTALGILIMNVQLFAMIGAGFSNPYACQWTDRTNVLTWVVIQIAYGYKDLLIFGMLFGAGIALMDDRARALSRSATGLHYRRMGVLLAFGLCHAYLIWSGDILFHYAICGCVVYLLRRLRPSVQLLIACLAYAVPIALLFFGDWLLPNLEPDKLELLYTQNFAPAAEQIAEHNEKYRAGWLAQFKPRALEALAVQTVLFSLGLFWVCGGSMLAGMALYRLGVLTLRIGSGVYWLLAVLGVAVGLPVIGYGLQLNFDAGWDPGYSFLRGRFLFLVAAPITALGYISLIMLICRAGVLRWLTTRLSAVGQMALTTYLTHSVICSLVFYGHGLGLVGKVDRVGQLVVVAAVWIFQLIVSPIWLRHYRFGPAEWLWRTLSYGKRQPMRREGGRAASATDLMPASLSKPTLQASDGFDSSRQPDSAFQQSNPVHTIWRLAAWVGLILPGLVIAIILGLIGKKLAGDLIGWVALYPVAAGALLIATRMCLRWFDGENLRAVGIGFDRPWFTQLICGVVGGGLLMTACWAAIIVVAEGHSVLPAQPPVRPVLRMTLGAVFTLGLSLYEELLCRGYLLQQVGRKRIRLALIISGLLFVAMHLPNSGGMTPVAMVNIGLLHLLMTVLYLRTRSLWLPVGVHAGWNFTLGYVFGLPVSGKPYAGAVLETSWQRTLWSGNDFGPEGGLIVTCAFTFAIFMVWHLIKQRSPQPDLLKLTDPLPTGQPAE